MKQGFAPFSATDLVHEACKQWPDLPSRTLARKLVQDNKGVWDSLNAAYCAVRFRRGKAGPAHRKHASVLVGSSAPNYSWNPECYLPKSEEMPFLPHVVSVDRDTRALVLGDIHLPYHNLPALTAALRHGQKQECSLVVLNGDTLDFHRLSRFQKDPRARSAFDEVASANQLLDCIDELFPKTRKIWKDGNHDERYDHYISAHAAEIFDIVKEHASLEKLVELENRGWEYVSEKRPIYLGNLSLLHGHEMPTPVIGPVNAARGLFLRTKASAMVSHHHQVSEHSEPDIRGKLITTWSIGCLCDLHPAYARFNRWAHGFALVNLAKNGNFEVENKRVIDGKLY
jgi:predicted phosphodiesterase